MGRELARQLAAAGCSAAACDVNPQTVEETAALAGTGTRPGVRVTGRRCDVCDDVDLVFSNAGIGGAAAS